MYFVVVLQQPSDPKIALLSFHIVLIRTLLHEGRIYIYEKNVDNTTFKASFREFLVTEVKMQSSLLTKRNGRNYLFLKSRLRSFKISLIILLNA